MQHGLTCLEADDECRGCRERDIKPVVTALSSQNILFSIGLGITGVPARFNIPLARRTGQKRGDWSI